MKNKILLFLFLYLLNSHSGFAQESSTYFDDLTKLSGWVSDIDSIIIRTNDKEKLKQISHQLSYVLEGLENITIGQKDLQDNIPKRGTVSDADTAKLQSLINQIAGDIDRLYNRLRKIKANVSPTDQAIIEPVIQSFETISKSRNFITLNDLRNYLYGKKQELKETRKDEKELKEMSEMLAEKISKAKEKIKGMSIK